MNNSQVNSDDMILEERWQKVQKIVNKSFPKICFGFGYGSGVLTQPNYNYNSNDFPMIDFILVVDDVKMSPPHNNPT